MFKAGGLYFLDIAIKIYKKLVKKHFIKVQVLELQLY